MKRHALFVGVDKYADPTIQDLAFPTKDANDLAGAFEWSLKFDRVEKLLGPEHADDILDVIGNMTKGLGPGDLFFFFFAGHGFRVKDNHVLVCARDNWGDLEDEDAGLRVGRLKKKLRGPWNRMIVLDACQNDIRTTRGADCGVTARDLSLIHEGDAAARPGEGVQILVTSCSEGQKALEVADLRHGLFTSAFLETVKTFADGHMFLDPGILKDDLSSRMQSLAARYRLVGNQEPMFTIPGNTRIVLLDGVSSPPLSSPVSPASVHAAMSEVQAFVECPVCYANVPKAGTHNCKKCGRPNVCGNCWDTARKCCTDCAAEAKVAEEARIAKERAEAEARRKAAEERAAKHIRLMDEAVLYPPDLPSISDLPAPSISDLPAPPDISDLPDWNEGDVDEEYSVRLVKVPGASRKKAIEIVKRWTGLNYADVRSLVDGLGVIKSGISAAEAEKLHLELERVGAAVSITGNDSNQDKFDFQGAAASAKSSEQNPLVGHASSGRDIFNNANVAGAPLTLTVGGATFYMRWCPKGTFLMGSPCDENDRYADETQHRVTLTKGFWMGATQITQGQWAAVMGDNPAYNKESLSFPVEMVSWDDCQKFVERLNSQAARSGETFRFALPTEAQWEYACRAGSGKPFGVARSGWGDHFWSSSYSDGETNAVGRSLPNSWGIFDMHGNVWEWCQDWLGEYPNGEATDPVGPRSGSARVIRGGGYDSEEKYCRSAMRLSCSAEKRCSNLGLRVVVIDARVDNDEFERALNRIFSLAPSPSPRATVGPNDPCPCGSGKKYKKCCGRGMESQLSEFHARI